MFYKPSLVFTISVAYFAISICLTIPTLIAQNLPINNPPSKPSGSSPQSTSNLIINNPFVPKNNEINNQPKTPSGPKSVSNSSQILQKYLQFKSIAIINKKKYFSIFNKRTNKSYWVHEGEKFENFRVTYYNPTNNTISISDGINTELIPIITANETPLSVASAPSQSSQEIAEPQIPGTAVSQNKDKPKTQARRRVIPVKR